MARRPGAAVRHGGRARQRRDDHGRSLRRGCQGERVIVASGRSSRRSARRARGARWGRRGRGHGRRGERDQVTDGAQRGGAFPAHRAGELVTLLGGYPSLSIGPLLETHHHDVGDILRESLAHEGEACAAYYELLELTQGKSVVLEDYARNLIVEEELHADEVNKMLRRTGTTAVYEAPKSDRK